MLYGAFKDGRVAFLACDDVAACGAALLTGSGPRHTAFVLTGPQALTLATIARTLSGSDNEKHVIQPCEQ